MTVGQYLQNGMTIFALASGRPPAGVAVVRISGPEAAAALEHLSGRALVSFRPREAMLLSLQDQGDFLDQALVLWFPAPASFTGEDVVELHLHGGFAVLESVLRVLSSLPNLRSAGPGEFSQRAFLNGKLDLTQAEGIADLVAAETDAQRRQALRQTEGALGALYAGWQDQLLRASAHLEATIDFAEEDLPDSLSAEVTGLLEGLRSELASHLADGARGERLRDGVRLAILGPPNAGKSSFLNRLLGRDAAIVSSQAGTTRDVVEAHMNIGGYPVVLADTAGLRETGDIIEEEGVRRARARATEADLRVLLLDATARGAGEAVLEDWDGVLTDSDLVVWNKADEAAGDLSVRTGEGWSDVIAKLEASIGQLAGLTETAAPTRARHRQGLDATLAALDRAREAWIGGLGSEVVAEEVRAARHALGVITGKVDVEDLLDVIFRDFCIGK